MRFAVLNADAERREGLKALLRQVDRQANFIDAQDWRQAHQQLRRKPADLLVIDWQDGMRLADLRALLSKYPDMPVAVLTDDTSMLWVRSLLAEGVLGIVPRGMPSRLIVHVFRISMAGGHYIPADTFLAPASSDAYLAMATDGPLSIVRPRRRCRLASGLSPRQEQILRCVHMGSTNKMIARALGISEGTVKIHLASVFQLLGAPNRAAAVAIYNGWLERQLEVLRRRDHASPRPLFGEPGVIPLRRARQSRQWRYLLPKAQVPAPMAAEPTQPYGKPASDGKRPPAAG